MGAMLGILLGENDVGFILGMVVGKIVGAVEGSGD